MDATTPFVDPITTTDTPEDSAEQRQRPAGRPRSLVLSVKASSEVTGRHQRGFDGEGSEGT